jgi:hypothetical protein
MMSWQKVTRSRRSWLPGSPWRRKALPADLDLLGVWGELPDDRVKMSMHRLSEASAWKQARKCVWYYTEGRGKKSGAARTRGRRCFCGSILRERRRLEQSKRPTGKLNNDEMPEMQSADLRFEAHGHDTNLSGLRGVVAATVTRGPEGTPLVRHTPHRYTAPPVLSFGGGRRGNGSTESIKPF